MRALRAHPKKLILRRGPTGPAGRRSAAFGHLRHWRAPTAPTMAGVRARPHPLSRGRGPGVPMNLRGALERQHHFVWARTHRLLPRQNIIPVIHISVGTGVPVSGARARNLRGPAPRQALAACTVLALRRANRRDRGRCVRGPSGHDRAMPTTSRWTAAAATGTQYPRSAAAGTASYRV